MNLIDVLANKHTPQEVYDFVLTKIREQGTDSSDEDGDFCAYRGHENTKCAIGHMIPDDLYDPKMEKFPVDELLHKFNLENPTTNSIISELLLSLQHAHDSASARENVSNFMPEFEFRMRNIADHYQFDYTPPN
jgi:hypothetical protein